MSFPAWDFEWILDLNNNDHNNINKEKENVSHEKFNDWFNIAITWNGNVVSVYLNGTFISSSLWSGFIKDYQSPLLIGVTQDNHQFSSFLGFIDDFNIWNVALPQEEINQLLFMNSIDDLQYLPYLVLALPFNEGRGLTISSLVNNIVGEFTTLYNQDLNLSANECWKPSPLKRNPIYVTEDHLTLIQLNGTDPLSFPFMFEITILPKYGQLYDPTLISLSNFSIGTINIYDKFNNKWIGYVPQKDYHGYDYYDYHHRRHPHPHPHHH